MMHSPEVELTEIFVSNIFNGNGLAWCKMCQDGCIRGYMVYPIVRALEHQIFSKMCFFQKVTPNFFYISDIKVQKLKLFVF